MKLLDKIAKRLGYVPIDMQMNAKVIYTPNKVQKLCADVCYGMEEIECITDMGFDIKKMAKRRIAENMINHLIPCITYVKRPNVLGGFTMSGILYVYDGSED